MQTVKGALQRIWNQNRLFQWSFKKNYLNKSTWFHWNNKRQLWLANKNDVISSSHDIWCISTLGEMRLVIFFEEEELAEAVKAKVQNGQISGSWNPTWLHKKLLQLFSLYYFFEFEPNLKYWKYTNSTTHWLFFVFSWTCGFTRSTIGIHRTCANLVYCWSHLDIHNSHWGIWICVNMFLKVHCWFVNLHNSCGKLIWYAMSMMTMMTADSDVFFGNVRNSLILPSCGYTRRKLTRLHALRRHRKTHLWGMAVGQRDAFVTDLSFPSILYLHTFPLNKLYGVKKRRVKRRKLTQTSGTVAEHCFKQTDPGGSCRRSSSSCCWGRGGNSLSSGSWIQACFTECARFTLLPLDTMNIHGPCTPPLKNLFGTSIFVWFCLKSSRTNICQHMCYIMCYVWPRKTTYPANQCKSNTLLEKADTYSITSSF